MYGKDRKKRHARTLAVYVVKMIRIMFVCHGNICRSPMAEFILKDLVKERGVQGDFVISSSATSTEEIYHGVGNPVYPPVRAVLADHGMDPGGKRAVQLKKNDYDKYDLFVGMDSANIRNMQRIFGGDSKGKMHKLLEYINSSADVSDPWYTRDFDRCYHDIYRGCEGLLNALIQPN